MKQLTATAARARATEALGLDPESLDLRSMEARAAALRRAAGFLCPCSATKLVHAVLSTWQGLYDEEEATLKGSIEESLEALIAYGDLQEHQMVDEEGQTGGVLLYATPPAFVQRQSGAVYLIGIIPEQAFLLPEALEVEVKHQAHVRRIPAHAVDDDFADTLIELEFTRLKEQRWFELPKTEHESSMVARYDHMLDGRRQVGQLEGLQLLDPTKPVRFYPKRWVVAQRQTGTYVARRPQRYGADLWCYVEMQEGIVTKLLDVPTAPDRWRGCDEAWYLQAAIDSTRGTPQQYRLRTGAPGKTLLDIFSPVPQWVRRRWDVVGSLLPETTGCLFCYAFSDAEIEQETRFLREHLWMTEYTL